MIAWLYRIFFVVFLCGSAAVWAIPGLTKTNSVKAELIARTDAVQPGGIFQAGFLLSHKPKWHTYWKATGDTGFPTTVQWTLPEGWKASEIQWPVPEAIKVGDFINYGYEGEVLLPVSIQVPADLKVGTEYPVKAKLSWLMCDDQCIPGSADLSLNIKISDAPKETSWVPVFNDADKLIPRANLTAETLMDPAKGQIIVTFKTDKKADAGFYVFAEGESTIVYSAPQEVTRTKDGYAIALKADDIKVGDPFSGLIVAAGGPAHGGWAESFNGTLKETSFVPGEAVKGAAGPGLGLLLAAGMAFIGGLILNLMPCVFPVLSLKILGIVNNRGANFRKLIGHGLSFTAGILVTMTALAAVLTIVKSAGASVGWGFQLQSPWFVGLLFLLFVAITLNLLGCYEFNLSIRSRSGSQNSGSTHIGSFATGVLAVVVASPCTAPFMGAALGYALSADTASSFAVFLALGLGMAFPWLLLTSFPKLTAWLPKPGMWMVKFRTIMAFPMALTALWLLWVLWQQVGPVVLVLFVSSAVLLAAGLWILGKVQFGWVRLKPALTALLGVAFLAYVAGSFLSFDKEHAAEVNAGTWSEQNVQNALAKGVPVFVDFTASWCVTCQANKLAVLQRAEVQNTFEKYGVRFFIADWTNRNEDITRALEKFGRSGVPLYLMYSPDGTVEVLPELLTIDTVVKAVKKAVKE